MSSATCIDDEIDLPGHFAMLGNVPLSWFHYGASFGSIWFQLKSGLSACNYLQLRNDRLPVGVQKLLLLKENCRSYGSFGWWSRGESNP
jgi:hypothetical protein